MQLFQPNNLSQLKPEFDAVQDSAFSTKVAKALGRFYDLPDWSATALRRARGVNLISQNFLVTVGSNRYFLKLRDVAQSSRLDAESRLTSELAALDLPVPHVIHTSTGDRVCALDDHCFALYEFEEGEYFSGRDGEIDSAAKCFGELTRKAQKLFDNSTFIAEPLGNSFLDRLRSLLAEAETCADPKVAQLIKDHHTYILEQASQINAQRSVVESPALPMHLDYHPLNLLIRDGRVGCVLDLEHLKVYPLLAGLGFAGYKLIRQVMVDPTSREVELKSPSLLTRWLQGWQQSFPESAFTATELGLGARYQVLFLIHLILEKSLRLGDDRSNYDLEKQIVSLYEIDKLVGLYGPLFTADSTLTAIVSPTFLSERTHER